MRGSGYITNLILDTGILGVIAFFRLVLWKFLALMRNDKFTRTFLLLFIVRIMLFGSVGTTNSWFLLGVLGQINLSNA